MYKTVPIDKTRIDAYGPNALMTCLGKITIIHMDNPLEDLIKKRVEEVLAEEAEDSMLEDDCPLCQMLKDKPFDVVYDGEDF